MALAAIWALSDLGKQRLAFSGGRDVPVSDGLHPRSGFVWDSGMAGPRLCQLLEVLGLPAFQVKVVYHPTNLATLGDYLLRLLCLLFLYSVTKTRVSYQCVCGGWGTLHAYALRLKRRHDCDLDRVAAEKRVSDVV